MLVWIRIMMGLILRLSQIIQGGYPFCSHFVDLLIDGTCTLRSKWPSATRHRGDAAMHTVIASTRLGRIPSRQSWGKCGGNHDHDIDEGREEEAQQ